MYDGNFRAVEGVDFEYDIRKRWLSPGRMLVRRMEMPYPSNRYDERTTLQP